MFFSMMAFLLLFVAVCGVALIWVLVNNQQYEKDKARRR
jgi:hypothetical protein